MADPEINLQIAFRFATGQHQLVRLILAYLIIELRLLDKF